MPISTQTKTVTDSQCVFQDSVSRSLCDSLQGPHLAL